MPKLAQVISAQRRCHDDEDGFVGKPKACYNANHVRSQKEEGLIMFGQLGPWELLLILVIVLLIFGVGRVSKIGRELGEGIREFRNGLSGSEEKEREHETEEEKA